MQNLQVARNTNGVARYVAKYIVKKDEGNRITLGANFHLGARMNVDKKNLHNTKITRSQINKEKALKKSKVGSINWEGALPIPTCREEF